MSTATTRRGRWLRGALVALIGVGALALPAANHSAHVADPWWGPETPAGDAVLVALSALLVAAGVWLARKDWERRYLTTVVVWTYAVTASVAVLFAWAIALQLWIVGEPEPYVLALDGVLIAALVAFASGVLTGKHRRDSDVVRRSEAEYRALVEELIDSSVTATMVTDADDNIALLNEAAAAYFGMDREGAVGRDWASVVDSAFEGPFEQSEQTASSNSETRGPTYRIRSGEDRDNRWVERCSHQIDAGLHVGGRIEEYTDVSERREYVETLDARAEGLNRLADALSAPSTGAGDTVGELLEVSRELLGMEYAAVSRLDTDGNHQVELARAAGDDPPEPDSVPTAHLRCREAVEDAGTVVSESGPFGAEVGGFRFDHGAAAVPDGGTPDAGFETYLGVPVAGSDGRTAVLCFLARDAREFDRWERTVTELVAGLLGMVFDDDQSLDGRAGRLEHERERLEFVNRVVRHNILNGLNLLNARTRQLERIADEDPEAAEHLAVIRDRIEEMSELTDTIRTFTDAVVAGSGHEVEPVPVRERLVDEVQDAEERCDATFRVHDLPDPGLLVEADELLSEVFENVLSNAVEHNDAENPVVLVWTSEGGSASSAEAEGARTLTVHVADNGPGISDETRRAMLSHADANLDDPGHGFGFYLVREMVESYDGEVRIRENEVGGTTVDLVFPVHGRVER